MKAIENQFWKYVIPSMVTVLLGGTYAIVDGIFIGQGTGDLGLTAVNIIGPIAAIVTALASGIGMGGAIVTSTYAGCNDDKNVKKARGSTILLLLLFSLMFLVIGILFSKHITLLVGANGEVFQPAYDYLKVILTFGCFQLFSSGLGNLVINSGKSVTAMLVMVGALIVNMVLDGIFVLVYNMGTFGAALATIIGQGGSALIYSLILFLDKKTRPESKDFRFDIIMIKKVVRTGLSPMGIQLAPSIVVMCINYACVLTNSNETLAAFAVMTQLILAIQILFTGIGNGIQPIISYCTGANNKMAVRKTLKKAMMFMSFISANLIFWVFIARDNFPRLFNASTEVSNIVEGVIFYVLVMIPFIGFNKVLIPFLFASSKNKEASLITYIEPVVVTPLCLLLFCMILGSYGIWISMVIAQVIISIIGIMVLRKYVKDKKTTIVEDE